MSDAARQEVERISRLEGTQSLEDFLRFAETVRSRTHLVLPIVGPSAPHRCTVEQLQRCQQAAVELDTMVHMHVCETKGQFLQGKVLFGAAPRFNEFVVQTREDPYAINERLLQHKMVGGLPLNKFYPELGNAAVWCCTELTTRGAIDTAVELAAESEPAVGSSKAEDAEEVAR